MVIRPIHAAHTLSCFWMRPAVWTKLDVRSAVGTVSGLTAAWLRDGGSIAVRRKRLYLPHTSRRYLWFIKPYIQWVTGAVASTEKWSEREAELKECNYTSTTHTCVCFHGMHKDNYTYCFVRNKCVPCAGCHIIYMYVCMYVCTHLCVYVCTCVYICVYVCVYVCIYVCMYASMRLCM